MMTLTLNACGMDRFDTRESTKALLPEIVQYGEKQTQGAIKEVRGNTCPIHVEFAKDYIKVRDGLRLIRDELK